MTLASKIHDTKVWTILWTDNDTGIICKKNQSFLYFLIVNEFAAYHIPAQIGLAER